MAIPTETRREPPKKSPEFVRAALDLGTNSSESDSSENNFQQKKRKNNRKMRDKIFDEFVALGKEIIESIFHGDSICSLTDSMSKSMVSSAGFEDVDKFAFREQSPSGPPKQRKFSCADTPKEQENWLRKRRNSMVVGALPAPNSLRTSICLAPPTRLEPRQNWRANLENRARKEMRRRLLKTRVLRVYNRLAVHWSLREIRWWNEQLEPELRSLLSTTPNKLRVLFRIFFETFDEVFPKTGAKAAEVLRVFARLVSDCADHGIYELLLVRVQKVYHFLTAPVKNQLQKMLRSEIKASKKQKDKRARLDSLLTPMFQRGKNSKKKLKFVLELSKKADQLSVADLASRFPVMTSGGTADEKRFFKALNAKWTRNMDQVQRRKDRFLEAVRGCHEQPKASRGILVLNPPKSAHKAPAPGFPSQCERSSDLSIPNLNSSLVSIERTGPKIEFRSQESKFRNLPEYELLAKRSRLDSYVSHEASQDKGKGQMNWGKKTIEQQMKRLAQGYNQEGGVEPTSIDSLTKDFDKLGLEAAERHARRGGEKYAGVLQKEVQLCKRKFKIKRVKGALKSTGQGVLLADSNSSFRSRELKFDQECLHQVRPFGKNDLIGAESVSKAPV